jgi:hypothetical protein
MRAAAHRLLPNAGGPRLVLFLLPISHNDAGDGCNATLIVAAATPKFFRFFPFLSLSLSLSCAPLFFNNRIYFAFCFDEGNGSVIFSTISIE